MTHLFFDMTHLCRSFTSYLHLWMSQVTHTYESCHTYVWVASIYNPWPIHFWHDLFTSFFFCCPQQKLFTPFFLCTTDLRCSSFVGYCATWQGSLDWFEVDLMGSPTFSCRVMRVLSHCNTLQHTATHCNTLQHTEWCVYCLTAIDC